jgi:hypothetical protein
MSAEEDNAVFKSPTAPRLTKNEKTWIEIIRVISNGSDPQVTPMRVRALRLLLDTT